MLCDICTRYGFYLYAQLLSEVELNITILGWARLMYQFTGREKPKKASTVWGNNLEFLFPLKILQGKKGSCENLDRLGFS